MTPFRKLWLFGLPLFYLSVIPCGAADGLLEAVRGGDPGAVRVALVPGKAEVNARQTDGSTALTWATRGGNAAIVKMLLDAGADSNIADENGDVPLTIAVQSGNAALATLLFCTVWIGIGMKIVNKLGDISV